MRRSWVAFLLVGSVSVMAQVPARQPPTPIEPIAAILDAFQSHDIVAVSDPHDENVQLQALLLSLIRDVRFPSTVNDIVMEMVSARYQDALDRFVRGEDVPTNVIRKAWEEHTVPNSLGVQAEELIRAVRAVNSSLAEGRKLRVIAGDPPIDWENITSPQDHRRWIELRDSYPADLVRRQVLDRGRRALVMYGQGHLQRRQIVSNYDMTTWESQTLVSLIEHDRAVRLFNVWTLLDRRIEVPNEVASWRMPSLATLRGTTLGATDFATYSGGFGSGRFALRNGQTVPLPREEWQTMPVEDQFDALLYLGPPSSMTNVKIPDALCQDSQFMTRRLERLARFVPPVEVTNLKKACGVK